jgi:iron(III) transport system substrate-binding protein
MKRKMLVGAIAAMALGMGGAAAQGVTDALLREAVATNKGEVVLHNALFDNLSTAMVNGFKAAYGAKGLTLKIVRSQSSQQVSIYEQQLRAGKVTEDMLMFVDEGQFRRYAKAGTITPYCSDNFKDFRQGAIGPDCSYFNITSYYQYMSYNPESVKAADVPKSWADLLNPKWKGKISIPDPKVGGGHYYFVFTMFKLFGDDWFVKVRANDPLQTQSHGVTNNQILAGERLAGINISVLARRDGPFPGGKGGPIQESFPAEGGALLAASVALTKGGPNPAGAKVFIEWASSLDGQKVINQLGHFSLRKDFTSIEGDDLSKIKYHVWDPDEMDAKRDEYTARAIRLLSGG